MTSEEITNVDVSRLKFLLGVSEIKTGDVACKICFISIKFTTFMTFTNKIKRDVKKCIHFQTQTFLNYTGETHQFTVESNCSI